MKSFGRSSVSRTSRRMVSFRRSLRPRIEPESNVDLQTLLRARAECNDRPRVSKAEPGLALAHARSDACRAPGWLDSPATRVVRSKKGGSSLRTVRRGGVLACSGHRRAPGRARGRTRVTCRRGLPTAIPWGALRPGSRAAIRRDRAGPRAWQQSARLLLMRLLCQSRGQAQVSCLLSEFGVFRVRRRKKGRHPPLTRVEPPRHFCHAAARRTPPSSATSPMKPGFEGAVSPTTP